MDKPSQKFNLVVYYDQGMNLQKLNKPPLFYENVYIYSDEQNLLYAYDSEKYDAKHEDPILEMMERLLDVCFKYNGIYIGGLELAEDKQSIKVGRNYNYQKWLLTNVGRLELEKENWYGPQQS